MIVRTIRGLIVRTVLRCIVYHSNCVEWYACIDEQILQMTVSVFVVIVTLISGVMWLVVVTVLVMGKKLLCIKAS